MGWITIPSGDHNAPAAFASIPTRVPNPPQIITPGWAGKINAFVNKPMIERR
jgi:hypothetical protein